MWHDILIAVALILVIEDILPFLSPDQLRKALLLMIQMDDKQLRFSGLTSMLVGVIVLYLINKWWKWVKIVGYYPKVSMNYYR